MKKLICVILSLLLFVLSGCTKKEEKIDVIDIDDNGGNENLVVAGDYFQALKDYEPREKNLNNTKDNVEFDDFLHQVFINGMEMDYLTMHYSVIHYANYGIEKPEVSIGSVAYNDYQEDYDFFEDELKQLQEFDYDSLSYRQQYDYEALEYSYYETLANLPYSKYNKLFTGDTDIVSSILTNLSDFTFYDEESVEDYMILIADFDRYLDDCLTYTNKQYADGIYTSDYSLDNAIKYCDSFLNTGDNNVLIVSFDQRMDELTFLSDKEKEDYKETNKKIVKEEAFPIIEKVKTELGKLKGKVTDCADIEVAKYDKQYGELLYMLQGSTNESIDDIFQDLLDYYDNYEAQLVTIIREDRDAYNEYVELYEESTKFPTYGMSSKEILDYLLNNLDDYYPSLGTVNYNVDEMDKDTANDSTIAYYWPSPLDDTNQNIIRTNPNNMGEEPHKDYTTLSHEGFPGHLYQHVYYLRTDPHYFRQTIGFIGYTEGWAVRAQMDAMKFSGISEGAASLLSSDTYDYFIYYSILDIGINYYGWGSEEINNFFSNTQFLYGYAEEDYSKEFIEFLTDMPGVYASYGIGLMNMTNLRIKASEELGNKFDMVEFNATLLKNGPLPFGILSGAVDEYIDSAK